MMVLQFNYSDLFGGAARAAYRLHQALLHFGVESRICVESKKSDDWTVRGAQDKIDKVQVLIRYAFGAAFKNVLKTQSQVLHSPSIMSSRWLKRLKGFNPDVIHLHWVCGEMLSISQIGRLSGPIVWTLHDMWPFCGAEHYAEDFRWREGYTPNNRPSYESRLDLNRWVWERKRKNWKRPFHIVAPSEWLGQCVRESALMKGWPVTVIPNALNTDAWAPIERSLARRLLNLPQDELLVLFGAMGGRQKFIKGFDLLRTALAHLRDQRSDLRLLVFGQGVPQEPDSLRFPVHYMGHLYDDLTIRVLYSAADVMVIPSRQDNLPNTGVESLACGTPVVAFDTCGLPDIVNHLKNGYLARPFDTEDLAAGIQWVLADSSRHAELSCNARATAVTRFSEEVVIPQYLAVYKKAIIAETT
jgi:glycosyltransferase involved in cell wall biosynthesis